MSAAPLKRRALAASVAAVISTGALAALTPSAAASTSAATAASTFTSTSASTAATSGLTLLRSMDVMAEDRATPGWLGDDGAHEGDRSTSDSVSTAGVAGAAPASVYGTTRWGRSFSYRLRDMRPGGAYTIRLHFVEDYYDAPGKRVFDVRANGVTAVSRLDVFAAAGRSHKAVVRDIPVTANALGNVDLTFAAGVDNAVLSGIQILRAGVVTTPARPVVRGSALTSRSALVEWQGDVDARHYTVYRDGRRLTTTTDSAFLDKSVVAGRTHRYRVVATGPTIKGSAPSAEVRVAVPRPTTTGTGRFTTRESRIVDPQGRVFVPVGANLGSPHTAVGAGVADGHAHHAKAWGWNAVRLTFYASDEFWWTMRAQKGYAAQLAEVRSLVDEYRAAGLVVIVDGHDIPELSPDPARTLAQMEQFWRDVATMYKGDSGVWFNLINEPQANGSSWFEVQERMLKAVRSTGAQNIAVVDAPAWGQDLGSVGPWFVNGAYGYDATMAPRLASRYGNVVLSQHNYGAYDIYTTKAAYGAYTDRVHAAGLPLITGETGFTVDGSSTAGGYDINRAAAYATFASNPGKGVGTFVWNGTHNDMYSLKADGSAFFTGPTVGSNLSAMGKALWALTH